jgi:hypothetical protein
MYIIIQRRAKRRRMSVGNWIKSLVTPVAKRSVTREMPGIALETLVNFAVAMNVRGYLTIPLEAIGAPTRLSVTRDGRVKFRYDGTPVRVLAKEIKNLGVTIPANLIATIVSDTHDIFTSQEAECVAMLKAAALAAEPIIETEGKVLADAIVARKKAIAEVGSDKGVCSGDLN